MKKFALVLGGGASKGYAHIGVIKVLEKNGLKPDLIVGTSMGALIGGFYALGKSIDEIEKIALDFKKIGNFNIFTALFRDNLLSINKLKKILNREVGNKTHKDCVIPFVSVATELNTGKEHHFSAGKMYNSMLASSAIPGVLPRIEIDGNYYCDGGLLNNLPEDVAKNIMPDAVILSVDVIGEYALQVENIKLKTVETLVNATTLMTSNVIKNRPQYADLRMTLTLPEVSQMDFSPKTTMFTINKGEALAKKHIKEIKQLLQGANDESTKRNTRKSKK